MKVAIIGMGNMGSKYAVMIAEGKISGMELIAVTRIRPERFNSIKNILPNDLFIYESAEKLFAAYDANEFFIDTVLIVTPHYSHEEIAINAFQRGLHVLCDKPAGVYSRQARNMLAAYKQAKLKSPTLAYGFIFHQRTFPVYQKMKEIVESKKYGNIKRVNWIVTDWYRPNTYYTADVWRATWAKDGGGTLLNQCPHNLDLLQWICQMPCHVTGFCHEGKYHSIEVEDDVTAYFEWENGTTGVFIASTGEAAGVNRLEISLDDALLVCEKGALKICYLDKPEIEYRTGLQDCFAKPTVTWEDIPCESNEHAYEKLLSNFANKIAGKEELIAPGNEAINSLYLSNAIYLSSWQHKMIELPKSETMQEQAFEQAFETLLNKKANNK